MAKLRPFEVIAAELAGHIEGSLAQTVDFGDGCPPTLAEAIRYVVLSPGKRIRPILVLLACEACGGNIAAARPAACAVELVHAYSLVHDDLPAMDNDDFRRGQPTCHRVFGEGIAILVGDALLARAFEILASFTSPREVVPLCCSTLARAAGAEWLVGGQADDLAAAGLIASGTTAGEGSGETSTLAAQVGKAGESGKVESRPRPVNASDLGQLVRSIHLRKTAALFRAAVLLGGLVARAKEEKLDALERYGEKLGLAFQIVDDILDFTGSKAEIGKTPGKDKAQKKLTYPAVFGLEESKRQAAQLIDEACKALEIFGSAADDLISVAQYVLHRRA